MKYIKAFNNRNDLEIYKKSKLTTPHVFLNKQNLRDLDYLEKYDRLEYISSTSTGGQYIDLGYKLLENTDDIRIDIKFNIFDHGKDGLQQSTLIAAQPESGAYPGFTMRINANDINSSTNVVTLNTKWLCSKDWSSYIENGKTRYGCIYFNPKRLNGDPAMGGGTFTYINRIYEYSIVLDQIPDSQINDFNCHLFCALDSSNQPFRYIAADLYYLKFTKGNTVIRNLVPVRRKSDNVVGLYDIENNHFYVSQGDEPFVAGPILEYNKIYNISYLESTGTQWIDTLIHPTTGYGFELYGGFTHFANNEFFGGGNNFNNGLGICTQYTGSYGIIVGTTEVCQISAEDNVMHLFKVNSDGTVYVDNEYKGQSTTQMPDGNYTMNIFKHSSTNVPLFAKIYYCKIFDNNDNLVFDGIPVRKNGIGYMFDRVTNTLFENKGTENFILGRDIL